MITVERAEETDVRFVITSGPVDISVVEGFTHLRQFWNQLGQVLNAIEHEKD